MLEAGKRTKSGRAKVLRAVFFIYDFKVLQKKQLERGKRHECEEMYSFALLFSVVGKFDGGWFGQSPSSNISEGTDDDSGR